jgi:hypothetical protein
MYVDQNDLDFYVISLYVLPGLRRFTTNNFLLCIEFLLTVTRSPIDKSWTADVTKFSLSEATQGEGMVDAVNRTAKLFTNLVTLLNHALFQGISILKMVRLWTINIVYIQNPLHLLT